MAEQTDQKEAAAKAAAEKEAKEKEAAAKAAVEKRAIVLKQEMHDPSGKLLPAGTELDPSEAWVKRCVLPYDLWETKKLAEAKKRAAEAEAEARALGEEMVAKAMKGSE